MDLIPRHAGHEHSQDHAHTAYIFWGVLAVLFVGYSAMALIWGMVYPSRKFQYPGVHLLVGIAAWAILLLFMTFRHHQWLLAWFARRFGRLGFAISIFAQYLALKPALLPRTYFVPLNFMHKWAGRTAVGLVVLHATLYTISYIKKGKFMKLLTVGANIWGIIAASAFLIMLITSLRPIRRRLYGLFFIVHVPLALVVTIAMIWHSRPSAAIMVEVSFFFFFLQLAWRVVTSRTTAVTVHHITPTLDLVLVDRKALPTEFQEGSHVRFSPRLYRPGAWLGATHPYTVASLDSDSDIKLVVRRTRWRFENDCLYSCFGPFGCAYDVFNHRKVVAFGGGAGISFVAPIWRTAKNSTATQVKAIWITRSAEELPLLDRLQLLECDVYITSQNSGYDDTLNAPSKEEEAMGPTDFELQPMGHENDEFDVDDAEDDGDQDQLLPSREQDIHGDYKKFHGRPDFTESTEEFLKPQSADGAPIDPSEVSIIACGPGQLVQDLRIWAARKGYHFFAEEYAL